MSQDTSTADTSACASLCVKATTLGGTETGLKMHLYVSKATPANMTGYTGPSWQDVVVPKAAAMMFLWKNASNSFPRQVPRWTQRDPGKGSRGDDVGI